MTSLLSSVLPLDVDIPEQTLPLGKVLARVNEVPVPPSSSGQTIPVSFLPDHVDDMVACAKFQIQALHAKEDENLTADDEDALDDGFFVCDLNVVYQKLQAWRRLFPRIKPFYAVKCNPDPMVVAVLGKAGGAGFDCASIPEIDLATRYVLSPRGAIYANPQRAERDLDTALRVHNVRVLTFDGSEELYKINRSYLEELQLAAKQGLEPPGKPQLVLRILVPDGQSSVPLGEKFGAPPDRIRPLVELAVELELPIVGTSFHGGSGNHDPDSYVQAIKLAKEALDAINEIQSFKNLAPCWLLDLGGGYPGADGAGASLGRFSGKSINNAAAWAAQDHHQYHDEDDNKEAGGDDHGHHKVTAANIAEVVTPLIDELFPPKEGQVHVVAEPGRYFVEEAFCLCSRIYRIRVDKAENGTVVHRHYYIAQGVQGVFKDCVLCGEVFIPHPLKMNDIHYKDITTTTTNGSDSEPKFPSTVHGPSFVSTVHGPSGEDYDVICPNYPLPELVVGDWLIFDSMGAYTLSIAARSGRPAVRYVAGGGVSEEN